MNEPGIEKLDQADLGLKSFNDILSLGESCVSMNGEHCEPLLKF
jgi:hypothetical protein